MKITKDTVGYVANLARLHFEEKQTEKMAAQLENIVTYMDTLNSLDTSGILPMEHVKPVCNVFREDIAAPSFDRESLLRNAPLKEEGAFKVPKIVD